MNLRILKRRVEMLDAVSTGLHPSVVIAQLAEKYSLSEKALWSDWLRRDKWVPLILGLEKYGEFSEVLKHKLDAVQREHGGTAYEKQRPSLFKDGFVGLAVIASAYQA